MTVRTFEAIVHNGTIRLPDDAPVAENAKVYVIVPDLREVPVAHISAPHLADPHQAQDFQKQVLEIPTDAKI